MAMVVQVIKPTSYKLLPEGVLTMPCFIILFSLDMEDPLPKFSSLLYPSPPPPHSILKYTGTHQQSKHEDGWPRKSSASPRVLQKQYPGLQRYHPETVPVTVSTQVQPQEQAGSLRRYHPEPVPVTDSEQVSQKQPESLHHASRVTGTVETFPRFVHLSVLWLVINTAVLVLCMWKNERQSGYQMLSFSAGCTHLLLLYFLRVHRPLLTPPTRFLGLYYVLFSHRPIRLTQCCTQFKPFGNKTFCFRNFHII